MPLTRPELGVIGGSGFQQLGDFSISERQQLNTPYGEPSNVYLTGHFRQKKIVFLTRHGEAHSIPPHKINYRANMYGFKLLGIREIISLAAVGGISDHCVPRSIVIPDQIIDYTCNRSHTYYDGSGRGLEFIDSNLQHVDFTHPYNGSIRRKLIHAAKSARVPCIDRGVYGVTEGPRLETAAEINRLERDGADIVGMTAMPEAGLARELSIAYGSIALVVNAAAGRDPDGFSMAAIAENLSRVTLDALKILEHY